jgi:hypothetical protein
LKMAEIKKTCVCAHLRVQTCMSGAYINPHRFTNANVINSGNQKSLAGLLLTLADRFFINAIANSPVALHSGLS